MKKIEAEITVDMKDYETSSFQDLLEKVYNCSMDMARQRNKIAFDKIDKITDKTGKKIDAKGKLTVDTIFQMFEMSEIDFDSRGKPINQFIVGKGAFEQIKSVFKQIEDDPQLKCKMDQLMEKKRIEAIDRENNRNLVG